MNYNGIIIGLATFLIIGLFRCWWVFVLAGLLFGILSLYLDHIVWSSIAGVTAFSSFWSIHEIIEQEERVKKGWFPANPKRKK